MDRINPERFRLLAEQARAGDKGAQSELLRICEKHQLGRRIQAQAMPESYSEESGQFDMTISSGTPVDAFDYETWEYIPRIIIAKGMELRPGRDSIPLLDSHDASTIGAILGRISRIRQEGNRVVGTVTIDRESARGREAEQKVKAGIVTDNSAGFDIIKKRYIPQNEYVTIEGQTYSGPLQIVEQSILYEASLCPIGLDDFALVQARNTTPKEGVQNMEKDLPTGAPPNAELNATPAAAAAQVVDLDEQRREAQAAERERVLTIQSIGRMAGLEPEAVAEAVEKGTPVAEFQKLATKKFTEQNTVKAPAVTVERDQQQQFLDSAADGYLARAGVLQSYASRVKPGYQPNPAHVEFSRASVVGIMREGLRLFGQSRNTHLMSDAQVVREFLTQGRGPSVFHGDSPHVHTTGVLTNVLGEIAYKSLMIGYAVANTTYQLWTRKVSLANFYTHSRVALSEAPTLELNTENAEIQEGLMSDRKETIQLATYAKILSFSEEALVNDDTSALVRVPQLLGTSASLVPNRLVYRILKANGNLSDGSALFNTTDGTLASSSAAISVTSVGVALAAMMNQKGALAADANGEQTCLNIRPRFLIVGPSKYTIARQFITSVADPASNNSAVVNPFAGALELITDAELEQGTSSSTTAWFVAADPNAIDTIEVGFLDGVDAPSMSSEEGFSYRGVKYAVKLHCAAAAIDRKGLFKNSGA